MTTPSRKNHMAPLGMKMFAYPNACIPPHRCISKVYQHKSSIQTQHLNARLHPRLEFASKRAHADCTNPEPFTGTLFTQAPPRRHRVVHASLLICHLGLTPPSDCRLEGRGGAGGRGTVFRSTRVERGMLQLEGFRGEPPLRKNSRLAAEEDRPVAVKDRKLGLLSPQW